MLTTIDIVYTIIVYVQDGAAIVANFILVYAIQTRLLLPTIYVNAKFVFV